VARYQYRKQIGSSLGVLKPSRVTPEHPREEHMKRILVFTTLAVIAAACSTTPDPRTTTPINPPTNNGNQSKGPLGVLAVTVEGIGTNSLKATAQLFDSPGQSGGQSGGLSAKAIDVPLVPSNGLLYQTAFTNSFDDTISNRRFLTVAFNITNNTSNSYNNLVHMAMALKNANVTGSNPNSTGLTGTISTIGGTNISNI
jgi:hypothetical protein